jgi:hypothetical protein
VVNLMDPEVKAAFDLQNEMRAAHGAPALAWDASLANDAMSWLAGCPMTKSKAWKDRGENMAWGYPEFKDGIKAWYSEVRGVGWGEARARPCLAGGARVGC